MIKTVVDLFKGLEGRVAIQLGTFVVLLIGAFYFGAQTRDFVRAQEETNESINHFRQTIEKLSSDKWVYQMQRDYNEQLHKLNQGKIQVPVVSEIREKHTN